jgi:hypothetical protein
MARDRYQPFSAVLRIAGIVLTKAALEAALQAKLDRYEPAKVGSTYYVQLDVPNESGSWSAVVDYIDVIGPRLATLRKEQHIGTATIDFAVAFHDDLAAFSVVVPGHVAETIGRHGIDTGISVYSTTGRHH